MVKRQFKGSGWKPTKKIGNKNFKLHTTSSKKSWAKENANSYRKRSTKHQARVIKNAKWSRGDRYAIYTRSK